jgi:hypothetical protein
VRVYVYYENSSSTAVNYTLDAPTPVGAGTYDDRNAAIRYSGTWSPVNNVTNANAATLTRSNTIRSVARLTFTGSRITRIYSMEPSNSGETVYIDGQLQTSPSSAAAETRRAVARTWDVSYGTHTIEVWANGAGYSDIDAFVVDIATVGAGIYDDTHSQIKFIGSWEGLAGIIGTWNTTMRRSNVVGSVVRFTFVGDNVTWYFSKDPTRGRAVVTIDGGTKGYYDLYAPTTQRQQSIVFDNLSAGTHIIHITVTNEKNPAATNYYLDVDHLDVIGGGCC